MSRRPEIDLKPIIEHALGDAREAVLAGRDYLRWFYAANAEGNLNVICAPCEGPDADTSLLRFLRLLFMALGVTQYAMVSEAWISSSPKYSRGAGGLPEDDPERGEGLIAIAVRRVLGESGNPVEIRSYANCAITRKPTCEVGAIEWPEWDNLEGRMFSLLPPHGAPPIPLERRELLLKLLGMPVFRHRIEKLDLDFKEGK